MKSPSDVARGSRPAEELELVDVQDPVGAVGEAVPANVVAVVREREEDLEEEQRHDREVVARETSRRQSHEPADDPADDRDERDHDDGRQVDVELVRAEERVRVRTHAEERDVAEVEQAAPPDDDVEPEREEHEDDGVERDPAHVAALEDAGQRADDGDEQREPGPPGDGGEPLLDRPEHPSAAAAALAVARDPLVATDLRARRALGGRRLGGALERPGQLVVVVAHDTQTFRMSALPKRPWGRKSMNPIRITNTSRSDHFVEM